MDNQFFKSIEKKTGVNMKDVLDLANSLQDANFKDEKTVRSVIQRVSQIANKPVSKDTENKIVESIVKDGKQLDFNTISNMINKEVIEKAVNFDSFFYPNITLISNCSQKS